LSMPTARCSTVCVLPTPAAGLASSLRESAARVDGAAPGRPPAPGPHPNKTTKIEASHPAAASRAIRCFAAAVTRTKLLPGTFWDFSDRRDARLGDIHVVLRAKRDRAVEPGGVEEELVHFKH
jgi:hypothetical protein